jgi:hypothetical protein
VDRAMWQISIVPLLAGLVLAGLNPAPAFAVDQPVAVADLGCGVVVMAAGDLYVAGLQGPIACPRTQGPWTALSNVFVSAGQSVGRVVGMNQNGQVLAANGDWFQIGIDYNNCNAISATFQGNVFGITGAGEPGETFVIFGSGGPGGGYEYAVTNSGSMFRWSGCGGWERVGSLNSGPTSSIRRSWGELKVRYR